MPRYDFKCAAGHSWTETMARGDSSFLLNSPCQCLQPDHGLCQLPLRRDYRSVSFASVMQEHFNPTVGQPISDMRQFTDALKRSSDAATERTGIPHNFVPIDASEAKPPE